MTHVYLALGTAVDTCNAVLSKAIMFLQRVAFPNQIPVFSSISVTKDAKGWNPMLAAEALDL